MKHLGEMEAYSANVEIPPQSMKEASFWISEIVASICERQQHAVFLHSLAASFLLKCCKELQGDGSGAAAAS